MTSARRTRVLAAIATLGIATGIGACTTGGTAVESMGVRYTEKDVSAVSADISEAMGQTLDRQNVVAMLAQVQPVFTLAEESGVAVIDDAFKDQAAKAFLESQTVDVDPATLSPATRDILASSSVASVLSNIMQENPELNERILEFMSEPATSVNPRYLNVTEGQFVPPGTLGDVVDKSSSPAQ